MRLPTRRALFALLALGTSVAAPLAVSAPAVSAPAVSAPADSALASVPVSVSTATPGLPNPCQLNAAALQPTGQLVHMITDSDNALKAPYPVEIYPAIAAAGTVTAMTSTSTQWDAVSSPPVYLYSRQFFVHGGDLYFGTTSYNTVKQTKTFGARKVGTGWGPFRHLADASDRNPERTKAGSLYAVNGYNGSLNRYRVTESTWGKPVLTKTGSKTGYGSIRSLTLAYQYRPWASDGQDALLATTSKGALLLITIPRSGTFAPRTTVLRSSTWTFDDLAITNCGSGWALMAVQKATQRALVYYIYSYQGTSTRIGYVGRIGTTWSATRTAGHWSEAGIPYRQ